MKSMGLRWVAAAVLAAGLALPAYGQDIDMVSTHEVATGTEITITGNGFGTKKPKVFTTLSSKKKEARDKWKVTDFSDTSITAFLKKVNKGLGAGMRDLVVQPKGADPIVDVGAITVMAPMITDVDPADSGPKMEVTINGDFFGTKKGKVFVGEAPAKGPKTLFKAKVLEWLNNKIRVRLHKKQKDGTHDVILDVKFAEASSADIVTTTGGPTNGGGGGGGDKVESSLFRANMGIQANQVGDGVAISGNEVRGGRSTKSFTMTVDTGGPFGNVAPGTKFTGDDVTVVYSETDLRRGTMDAYEDDPDFEATVVSVNGNKLVVDFEGTLNKKSGPGRDTLNLNNGRAEVTVN